MQELSINEIDNVSGGNPVVIAIVVGAASTVVGNYIYESIGGAAGINKALRNLQNAFM